LPDVDEQFRQLDSRMRLRVEQHKTLVQRRDDLLTMPRAEFLATREEQAVLASLANMQQQLQTADSPFDDGLLHRIERLRGLFTWTLETEYHVRLTRFDSNLRALDDAMVELRTQYDAYVRSRQAATHSYVGYQTPVSRMRARVAESVSKIDQLMARQGRLLESVAVEELVARRERLQDYRDKARFALADSYDRATAAQARADLP
jgi:hypothetical protein